MDEKRQEGSPPRLPWPPLLMAAAIVGAYVLGRLLPWHWPAAIAPSARLAGALLLIAGILLAVFGLLTLSTRRTTFRPDRTPTALVTSGPFRWSRNPIYVADVLVLLGLAGLLGWVWLLLLVVPFVLLLTRLAILPEERLLEAQFGAEFRNYRARVRRWI
ncbi:MAG: isoprenylcysteine carboxylmethyltransferase family protein [Hyphomicrobiaceae bacterium]|nr:MAG: isoprenylcysteine carboxylmethyltransferase family protein [Hyphomicrobiaceae bacterium]